MLVYPKPLYLSLAHAFMTIVQSVFYIRLYDFFYLDELEEKGEF